MDAAILKFFESIRCPFLTGFFGVFTFLGEGLTLGAAVILLYWLLGSAGEQLFFTAVTSFSLNGALKAGVSRPRPYRAGVVSRIEVDNFFVSTMDLGDTLSFPSGHVQSISSALLAESLRVGKILLWAGTVVVILLVAASRLYFGVHYPTDVLAGLLLGIFVALLWHIVFTRFFRWRYAVLAFVAAALLIALPFAAASDSYQAAGLLAGGAFFLPFAHALRCPDPKGWKRLLRIPVGGLLAGAVFALTLLFPEDAGLTLLKWFLITGAATLGATALFKLLKI